MTGTDQPSFPVWARGSRKNAHCRVRLLPGKGQMSVNNRTVEEYFAGNVRQRLLAVRPVAQVKNAQDFDVFIDVHGGGITGQAEAISHGVAHAFAKLDPALRRLMRQQGFLTRDTRVVERKKSGQPKARKRFQYSKR